VESKTVGLDVHSRRPPTTEGGFPFVGRQAELVTLEGHLEAATRGRGGVVLISGEPGIGKTRLALELARRAQSEGWQVLYGRASAVEAAPSYLPIIEALGGFVDACSSEALRIYLGHAAADVALLLPTIRDRISDIEQGTTGVAESMRFRLLASVSEFLLSIAAASKSGLLLVQEDLHWADASTLLLLGLLASKLSGARLILLGTLRSAEVDLSPPLTDLLADLSRASMGEHVGLPPLTPADVSTLVVSLHGAPVPHEVIDGLYAETEGNPFFLTSILNQLLRTGCNLGDVRAVRMRKAIPQDLRWVVRQRISRLSPATHDLLRAGAVLGDDFDFDVLAEMLGTRDDLTIAALEEALAADTLRPEGTGYRFTHALIRETLYDGLSHPRRQRLHFAAASAIERINSGTIDSHLAEIAVHYRLAGSQADQSKVVDYSLRAGEAAAALFAWEEVAAHWEAALESMVAQWTDPEVRAGHLERLAKVMFILGWDYYPRQIAYLERALEAYRQTSDFQATTRLHVDLAAAYFRINASTVNQRRSMCHFKAAEALLSAHPDEKLANLRYQNLAAAYTWTAQTAEGLAACQRALSLDAQLAPEDRFGEPRAMGWHLASAGKLAEGAAALERACEIDRERSGIDSYFSYAFRSNLAFWLGDPRDSYEWMRRGLASSELSPQRRAAILCMMAAARAEAGDLDEACRLQAETGWQGLDHLAVLFPAPLIAFRTGDWERARTLWTDARERHRRTGTRWCEADFACWLAQVCRVQGDIDAAKTMLNEALAIGLEAPSELIEMWTRPELAMLCAQERRLAEAEQHLRRCRAIMAAGEQWRGLAGRVALAEALTASSGADWEVGELQFNRALSIFQRWTLPWSEAEALSAWGSALVAAGRRRLAVDKFSAARDIYHRHKVGEPWVKHVEALQH
jgi:tetratricopeptide (TPR) repeat protein